MLKNILLLLTILYLSSCFETKNETSKQFKAGFNTIHAVDRTRIYKPNSDTADYLHYRPLDIDIWYPANPSPNDSVLLFRNILGLLDQRANSYTASNAGNGISQQIAQLFCTVFKCSDTSKLLNFKTSSFHNSLPAVSKFPLIIYLSSFNGMSFENYTLFEDLAKKGFVVACISSIGRYPGDMTMKYEDLMEQVNDAVACVNELKQNSNIDFSKIGIAGYSWGGLAGAVLAEKIPNVGCLISLDGSEFHHYGNAKDENAAFNGIRNSQDFKQLKLPMPYLRLESAPSDAKDKEDSVYNFSEKLSGDVQRFKVDSAEHEDFGCLSRVVKESGNCKDNQHFNTISKLTISFLEDHLKNEGSFSQTVSLEINKTITKK
ncbi:MAG: dienelactone hydrolase family protein [Bacteroidetes bacterium]|nr:dienelactone hydrolase family protein [Bacteroidota bacterium]